MLIKRFVVFLFSIFLFLNGFAQKATISGIISDSFNHPLFGASVSVFGKSIGTTTDEDGKYSLDVPINISLKIILSFTGLSTDSVFVKLAEGEQRTISKSLKENIFQMRDVNIDDKSFKSENIKTLNPKVVRYLPTPNQSVEDLLKTMPEMVAFWANPFRNRNIENRKTTKRLISIVCYYFSSLYLVSFFLKAPFCHI